MKSKKFIAALCALAVVVSSSGGLPFSGLRLFDTAVTASAEETETLLTTITATGKEQASYSTADRATVSFSYTANGYSSYTNNGTTATWGWWGYGWTATVTPAEGYTITKCVFYDDKDRTATDSEAPFAVKTTEEDKTPQVNGNPILAYTSKGIKKIEVYGYATPTATSPTYTITIPAEVNLKSADPVNITAKDVTLNEGQKIVVTLDRASNTTSGSEFSAKDKSGESVVNYSIKAGNTDVAVGDTVAEFETKTGEQSAALTFTKDADSTPTFAGTHTETLTFAVKLETAKTAAEKPGIVQADCTFSPSNGKSTLSNANITTAMEYSADNGTTWTDVTSAGSIASLAAGTVQIRVKETDEKLASEAVSITVPEVLQINELVGPYTGDRLTCEYYAGETWQALVDRYDLIKVYRGRAAFGSDGFIYYETGGMVPVTDLVDNTKTYEVL